MPRGDGRFLLLQSRYTCHSMAIMFKAPAPSARPSVGELDIETCVALSHTSGSSLQSTAAAAVPNNDRVGSIPMPPVAVCRIPAAQWPPATAARKYVLNGSIRRPATAHREAGQSGRPRPQRPCLRYPGHTPGRARDLYRLRNSYRRACRRGSARTARG